MVNWEILGIAPTNDISVIKKAYRAKLADTNPEDKPEEFMELRRSYEEAVELAKRPDEDAESADEDGQKEEYFQTLLPPEHPAFSWFQQARRLYRDFYRRIVPENWSRLAADPVCSRIDTAADARNALLTFSWGTGFFRMKSSARWIPPFIFVKIRKNLWKIIRENA